MRLLLLLLVPAMALAQPKTAADFGFRHLTMSFGDDTVDILVKSKDGDTETPKPLLLFCQGSLPQPLIKYDEQGAFDVFPFDPAIFADAYHVVIIGKPAVPVISEVKFLGPEFTYRNAEGNTPKDYSDRNTLDYYADRNIAVLKYLRRQPWASRKGLVVAGHSEGSTIAAEIARRYGEVERLIYSGGNPMGRVTSVIAQLRRSETASVPMAEGEFDFWKTVVADPENTDTAFGDSNRTYSGFSKPPIENLRKLRISILVSYGTQDVACPFNDYFRIECLSEKRTNVSFFPLVDTEHNYFGLKPDGQPDFSRFHWDDVARRWRQWLDAP